LRDTETYPYITQKHHKVNVFKRNYKQVSTKLGKSQHSVKTTNTDVTNKLID